MLLVFISFIFYLSLGIYTKIRFIFYPILSRACIKIVQKIYEVNGEQTIVQLLHSYPYR